MIATHHQPHHLPAWDTLVGGLDAVAGPPPRRIATTDRRPQLAIPALALQALLWGVALGMLAPATTVLVLLSGVAAGGAGVLGSTDYAFFFGFVPLLTVLVTVLLSVNHWPLRSLAAYHRELALGLFAVGAVLLVPLRDHGAAVTGDRWDHGWVFVNGSLVLHVLAIWGLTRLASTHLAGLHARRAGWASGAVRPGPAQHRVRMLAWDPPRRAATTALGLHTFLWGLMVAAAAGAAAGTTLFPGIGTIAGAYLGAIYGLAPVVAGTALLVTVVSWRRDTDPRAVERAVQVTLALAGAASLVGAALFLRSFDLSSTLVAGHPQWPWLAMAPVVVLLLRQAAPELTTTYVHRIPTEAGDPANPANPAEPVDQGG
jgi:hypothetical protein